MDNNGVASLLNDSFVGLSGLFYLYVICINSLDSLIIVVMEPHILCFPS
jgi:hypothetical protein